MFVCGRLWFYYFGTYLTPSVNLVCWWCRWDCRLAPRPRYIRGHTCNTVRPPVPRLVAPRVGDLYWRRNWILGRCMRFGRALDAKKVLPCCRADRGVCFSGWEKGFQMCLLLWLIFNSTKNSDTSSRCAAPWKRGRCVLGDGGAETRPNWSPTRMHPACCWGLKGSCCSPVRLAVKTPMWCQRHCDVPPGFFLSSRSGHSLDV